MFGPYPALNAPPPDRPFRRLRRLAAPAVCALFALAAFGVRAATSLPPGLIVVEDVRVEILNSRKLSYRIRATRGEMSEETREVLLDRPRVEIFDENEAVRNRLGGAGGRFWPVKVRTTDETGVERAVTKYNWDLSGDVTVASDQGHAIRTESILYDSATGTLSSKDRLDFRVPTGRGSILAGSAGEFEVELDKDSGKLKKWTLRKEVRLISTPEEKE